MKTTLLVLAVALAAVVSGSAQIRYVTVRTVKSPTPAMAFPPFVPLSNNAPVVATAPVLPPTAPVLPPTVVLQAPPAKPSLDKAELEQHVVAFQKQRAEEGSASAQYELGLRYLTGKGVERDMALARKWLKQSAEGGNHEAEKKLRELSKSATPDGDKSSPKQ